MPAPKGKHSFGTVKVGEKGQIVIPKQARDLFDIHPGDTLLVLGDEETGLAILKSEIFMEIFRHSFFRATPAQGAEDSCEAIIEELMKGESDHDGSH